MFIVYWLFDSCAPAERDMFVLPSSYMSLLKERQINEWLMAINILLLRSKEPSSPEQRTQLSGART